MADSDLEIRATLEAQEAKRKAEELGEGVEKAMDAASEAASKAADAVEAVGDAARDSAAPVRTVGEAMNGVATAADEAGGAAARAGRETAEAMDKAARKADDLKGRLEEVNTAAQISTRQIISVASHLASFGIAAYNAANPDAMSKPVSGALQMGLQGAGMGAMFGPWGALLGGVGGAALGWWTGNKQDERATAEAAAARDATIAGSDKALANMQWEMEKAAYLKGIFKDLADTSKSVADRETVRAGAISHLEDAQKRLMSWMQDPNVKADPAKMQEYMRLYAQNASSLDRLRDARVEEEKEKPSSKAVDEHKTETFAKRTQTETDQLTRLGINVGAAQPRTVESIERNVIEIKGLLRELGIAEREDITVWQ